jgi:hypothetical protein
MGKPLSILTTRLLTLELKSPDVLHQGFLLKTVQAGQNMSHPKQLSASNRVARLGLR